jgi:hypothetical protein
MSNKEFWEYFDRLNRNMLEHFKVNKNHLYRIDDYADSIIYTISGIVNKLNKPDKAGDIIFIKDVKSNISYMATIAGGICQYNPNDDYYKDKINDSSSEIIKPTSKPKCTCGAEKCGGKHYDWCDLSKPKEGLGN